MLEFAPRPFPTEPGLRVILPDLDPEAHKEVRDLVAVYLTGMGRRIIGPLSNDSVFYLKVCLEELLTNADRAEEERHPTELLAGAVGSVFYIGIGDDSAENPSASNDQREKDTTGRGLDLVEGLASEYGYSTGPHGNPRTRKMIWFGLDLAA